IRVLTGVLLARIGHRYIDFTGSGRPGSFLVCTHSGLATLVYGLLNLEAAPADDVRGSGCRWSESDLLESLARRNQDEAATRCTKRCCSFSNSSRSAALAACPPRPCPA